ncbi:substrate-binding domain-containing protein [Aquiflexum sp.]|uniref:substrate-binding domain-containing protein n=1 Tax=Aquiflexum sp. TaxID=1872584 RepID=UPI003592F776
MDKIRITGVPEHFNYPWVKVVESQPFLQEGIELEWINEPKGSGAMNKAIRSGETDLAIILTESFIKDKIEGNPGLIIGLHVTSPLVWGIHLPANSPVSEIRQLEKQQFVISRFGSGSHLMAFVLAKREKWNPELLEFEVVGDLEGAKKALGGKDNKIFLWEKYTTKPLVDSGTFKRIGEVPTPWPCFSIVAHPTALDKNPEIIRRLRDLVYKMSNELSKKEDYAKQLSQYYKIQEEDIKAWLNQTQWSTDNTISIKMLEETMGVLLELGLIDKPTKPEKLLFTPLLVLVE